MALICSAASQENQSVITPSHSSPIYGVPGSEFSMEIEETPMRWAVSVINSVAFGLGFILTLTMFVMKRGPCGTSYRYTFTLTATSCKFLVTDSIAFFAGDSLTIPFMVVISVLEHYICLAVAATIVAMGG